MARLLIFISLLYVLHIHQVVASEDYKGMNVTSIELEMIELINKHRESIGLNSLSVLNEANEISRDHSSFMAFNFRGLTHEGFTSRINEIDASTDTKVYRAGENVAYNDSIRKAHKALLNSPGHRKNIEGTYSHLGLGVTIDENDRIYVTQIFIRLGDS